MEVAVAARARILAFSLLPSRCLLFRASFDGEALTLALTAGDDASRALFFDTTSTTGCRSKYVRTKFGERERERD